MNKKTSLLCYLRKDDSTGIRNLQLGKQKGYNDVSDGGGGQSNAVRPEDGHAKLLLKSIARTRLGRHLEEHAIMRLRRAMKGG
jgi:hypothetical protein